MKLAHALLAALKDYGAGEIFGIPGDFALPFFREIERAGILPLHTLSHEPAVGFAADAAARYRGTLGVAAVTYGAGALNMVNAVATAYAEKSAVAVISGAPGAAEGRMGLGLHHQVKRLDSQLLVMGEVTCAQAVLDDAASAPREIARVLGEARRQSRPVYLELPRDMVAAEVGKVPAWAPPAIDRAAAGAAADEVFARLAAARRPALLLGVEVRRYGLEKKVARLAKKLAIPTLTSFMGRGILAETGAPLAGTYLGLAGEARVRNLVERSDGLLMLGVILCDANFGVSQQQVDMRTAAHAFDGEVRLAHHVYPGVTLEALVDALLKRARRLGDAAPVAAEYPTGFKADAQPIRPLDIATAVNDLFARHGVMPIAADMGDCLFTAMDIVPGPLVAAGYYATMGAGVPFGFGLQAASRKRPLVLVGDGAGAAVIAKGRVVFDGPPAELEARSSTHNAVAIRVGIADVGRVTGGIGNLAAVERIESMGEADGVASILIVPRGGRSIIAELSQAVRDLDVAVEEILVERGRLDDVFRELTMAG